MYIIECKKKGYLKTRARHDSAFTKNKDEALVLIDMDVVLEIISDLCIIYSLIHKITVGIESTETYYWKRTAQAKKIIDISITNHFTEDEKVRKSKRYPAIINGDLDFCIDGDSNLEEVLNKIESIEIAIPSPSRPGTILKSPEEEV